MEAVGFCEFWGEPYCTECAGKKWTPLAVAKAERGLAATVELEPLSRYSLIEDAEERGFQEALERLVRFKAEHPMFADVLVPDSAWPIRTGIVCRFAFWHARDYCSDCGKPLVGGKDIRGVGQWGAAA